MGSNADSNLQAWKLDLQNQMNGLDDKMKAINAKFDNIKAAQDINDGYIKNEVDKHYTFMRNQVEIQGTMLVGITDKFVDINQALVNLQNRPINGNGGGSNNQPRSIMEYKAICNIERLTNETQGFHMWTLRLKNLMDSASMLAIDN